MRKTTYFITLLFFVVFNSYAQEKYSRIKISNPSQQQINTIASQGIELSCGVEHEGENIVIELSETELNNLQNANIPYTVEVDDVSEFYANRAQNTVHRRSRAPRADNSSNTIMSKSISSVIQNNILQYSGSSEIDFVEPQNFPDVNALSMGGCLTLSEMKSQLDAMYTYSQTNGLDIISQKANASSTGQKTWGNPTNNYPNPQNNGPSTYSGTGSTRWDPETIWYVRITGNQSSTPEGTKPQMLFTSMIHSREVSALMNNIYFMWYLLENYNTDPGIKELVDNNELYFVPVVNPDGLRYNEVTDPSGGGMQRKNLRPYGTTTNPSRGVDLNRNFDYYWGLNDTGSSGSSTSGTYRGPSPESEPETQIMVDFITNRNFQSAVWNHSYANSVPHPYGGDPNANTDREDEYYRWHEEMTRYNRYLYGATIFYESNGLPDDWMVGGLPDNNGSTGLNAHGQSIIATTPEHGGSGDGFWPSRSNIVPIAKKSMRISLGTAYYGGKYAKLHDLTQSNITTTSNVPLDFGIERVGQTPSDFTVTVTPISANITTASPVSVTASGIQINTTTNSYRNQTEVTALIDLDPSISPNEKIEYNVKFSNDDGVIYEANYVKYYQPTVLFSNTPDTDGLTGWTQSGGWATTTSDAYSGSSAINTGTYSTNATKTLTTTNSYDFSNSNEVLIQFYAKWDIERNYDYVEVLGSPNGGSSWISLSGKYTKPEATSSTTNHDNKNSSYSTFQSGSSGNIYDGDRMDNWVMEEFVIDDSYSSLLNSNDVKIRFRFRTDALNVNESYTTTNDGYFIDDFKIISLQIPCETTVPTNLAANTITDSTAEITWDNIPSATYDLRYRESGAPSWTEVTDFAGSTYTLTGLNITTDYEVQVRSRCVASTSTYSSSLNFTTTDVSYCTASGSTTQYEYIGNVNVNGVNNNTSGTPGSGYSDFTNSDIFEPMQIGSTGNTISVTKTWPGNGYNEAISVWIDYNKDGTFDASEKILEDGANQTTPVSDSFDVPISAVTGSTRMRVIMKYYSGSNSIQNDPCENFSDGEVEDYNVFLYNGLLYTNSTWYPSAPTDLTGSENILILDGTYTINSNISVNNFTVASGATVNVNKENAVTVNGDITNSGEFVFNSDSNEFSSLILSGNSSDNLKYNRHVNSSANRNDLIATPFSGETFVDFVSNNSNIVSNTGETLYLFGPFDKTASDYITYSNTETSTLDAGKGYRAASTDNSTFTFTGSPTTGTLNVPISKTGSAFEIWNLIGNPYPSYIKLEDFLTANIAQLDSESAAVYGYDADNSNGSYWTIWNLAYASINPNTLIAPGQGFFVSSKDGGGTISFTPSMQASGSSDDFISGRNSSQPEYGTIVMNSSTQNFSTDIYFTNTATLNLDIGYDAAHFDGIPTDFSIYSELVNDNSGREMAIQAIGYNDIDNSPVIPLGVNANQGEQITIGLNNSNISFNIYLEDVLTNTYTLLNTSDYTFTPSTNLSGTGRFYLRFAESTLSSDESELDTLQVYSDNKANEIIIKGQLQRPSTATLFDIQGRQISKNALETNSIKNTINTSQLSAGIYIVQISNNVSNLTKKVTIN
ncbi:M14 family zinc carboxypeptidase [Winogradskyella pulchriflava]|uniref:M14 family zinc carboxypeptidase n=1 Tax=Winogradskyella pulchriflava TaxID=1110688 RepID=A0ABV6Q7N7_9FLAO